MKLHSLIICLVLGATLIASAQTAADPRQPPLKSGAGTTHQSSGVIFPAGQPPLKSAGTFGVNGSTAGQGALVDFSAQAGLLEVVVEQMVDAYSKAVRDNGSSGIPVPTLVYGPGAREARLGAPLRLANLMEVRIVDSLALVAAGAGCILDPIYAPRLDGDENKQHIIGYRIALASDRTLSPSPTTGGDVGGGESGAGDQPMGIGVALGQKDGYIIVAQVIPGSPAAQYHAFNLGDRILQVAEMGQPWVDVTGLPLEKVTKMIRGKPGSLVRLTIDPIPGHDLPIFGGVGGIYFVAIEREKLDPTPPKALIPKVAKVNVPDLTLVPTIVGDSISIGVALAPKPGKAGDPVKHPLPNPTPDETDLPVVRIYATGSVLSGNDEEKKEDDFQHLVNEAFDLAGLAKGPAPQLYFHMKSGVLIARTTARRHEIIEQLVNALRESSMGGPLPNPPKP